jgi:hypothetical protein
VWSERRAGKEGGRREKKAKEGTDSLCRESCGYAPMATQAKAQPHPLRQQKSFLMFFLMLFLMFFLM